MTLVICLFVSYEMIQKTIHILFSIFIAAISISAQKVTISKDISIRNDFGYEVLGNINDRIILYRDKHATQEIEVYDKDLQHIYNRELSLEKKKSIVHGVTSFDTCFHIAYSYTTDSLRTVLRKYDETGTALDTVLLFTAKKRMNANQFKYVTSADKSKSLIFNFSYKEGIFLYLFDHKNMASAPPLAFVIEKRKDYSEFKNLTISNEGEVFILFENYNKKFLREKHNFQLLSANMYTGEFIEESIPFKDWISIDVKSAYDDKNKIYHIAGLYNDKESQNSKGLFTYKRGNAHAESLGIQLKPFDVSFLNDLYKDQKREKLQYHVLKELTFAIDGSLILFTEYNKVFSRRTPFQGYGQNSNFRNSGWMDHYIEEVLIFSFSPEGDIRWKNLLLKKQFSQDDNAAFSSFFLFTLPSRMMLIFNDDIRKNNLVSEFEISPSGKLSRNSLMSTENQDLKLRFSGATQISNTSFIVPSEMSNKLRLVMISYQ